MSDYPLWAYRHQLELKARKELGYGNPLMDQKQHQAIKMAITEKVESLRAKQQTELRQMVNKAKDKL